MNMVEVSVLECQTQPRRPMPFDNQKVYGSTTPLVSQSVLDKECKPLEVAMNILRQRAKTSFRSGYVRVVRKQKNTQHVPMAFVDGGLIQR